MYILSVGIVWIAYKVLINHPLVLQMFLRNHQIFKIVSWLDLKTMAMKYEQTTVNLKSGSNLAQATGVSGLFTFPQTLVTFSIENFLAKYHARHAR